MKRTTAKKSSRTTSNRRAAAPAPAAAAGSAKDLAIGASAARGDQAIQSGAARRDSALAAPQPEPKQGLAPKSEEKTAATKPTAAGQNPGLAFLLFEPQAREVALAGDFNGWSAAATPMLRQPDGHWKTVISLAPGRYEYKFVVDGQWIPDPHSQKQVWNRHGTLNSVVEVREGSTHEN